MDIDWDNAPEWAEVYIIDTIGGHDPGFHKSKGNAWEDASGKFWEKGLSYLKVIPRPTRPDWDNAPEGATHFRGESYEPRWYNFNAKKYWSKSRQKWCNSDAIRLGQVSAAEMIPRPTKPAAPEWDAETFIQAGHRLQARVNDNPWLSGEITYRSDSGVVFRPDDGGDELFWRFALFDVEFRPLRTKEQRDREDLTKLIDEHQELSGSFVTPENTADAIIAAGWTKP